MHDYKLDGCLCDMLSAGGGCKLAAVTGCKCHLHVAVESRASLRNVCRSCYGVVDKLPALSTAAGSIPGFSSLSDETLICGPVPI